MLKTTNYCYLIRDQATGLQYIGSRVTTDPKRIKGNTLEEDLRGYCSSSKTDIAEGWRANRGQTFDIIKIFSCNSKAETLATEIELHNFFDVAANPAFLNKASATTTGFSTAGAPPEQHSQYNRQVYTFVNTQLGLTEVCTQYDLRSKYKLDSGNTTKLIKGKYKSTGGWSLVR